MQKEDKENYDQFQCSGCGLCCKAINCQYLQEDNKCAIYETRPVICSVDKGYEMYFKDHMSKKVWYAINYKVCSDLQKQENK
jgi:Fe-S-cluster containining protein